MLKVKVINKSKHNLPGYQTSLSAGMDLCADINVPFLLNPGERAMIPTGLYLELPEGYEAQIRPRSGLAWKHGITVINSPGTVDADYRGEIKVVLINLSQKAYQVNDGDRIAQMVISKYEKVGWEQVELLSETGRGSGGYGSTDIN